MTFRRIFLHIGHHKTGSSSIQLTCDDNRSLLADLGIYYPRGRWHGQLGSCFSQNKTSYIYNRHSRNLDLAAIIQTDKAYLRAFEIELSKIDCDVLVLSYEGFIDLDRNELSKLRDFLLSYGSQITVMAYCRHPLSFAPSEISQRCRMGVPSGRGQLDNAPIPKFRKYFEKFVLTFDKKNIVLADFSPKTLWKHDIRLDFLAKIGVAEAQQRKFALPTTRTNESLSAEAVLIGETMRKRLAPASHANLFYLRFNDILGSIKGAPLTLSENERRMIMAAAEPELAYLANCFGLILEPPQAPTGPDLRISEQTLESIADYLIANDPIIQGYRWLLGREPESDEVVVRHLTATGGDWRRLRAHIMRSREFKALAAGAGSPPGQALASSELNAPDAGLILFEDVTVCMIVHDEEEFIERSLRPLAQVFTNFVIADMGSSDRTVSLIKDFLGSKVSLLTYDRRKLIEAGYSSARNFCASHVTSQWILMVDADEVLVSGPEKTGIRIDCPVAEAGLVSVERRNLSRPGALLPEGVKPMERPRRLYRNDGSAQWTGYIHEELAATAGQAGRKSANSSLVFDHLSELRNREHDQHKRSMYRWMLLRAYENPSMRGGTNAWWYDKFVPENMEMLKSSARQFDRWLKQSKSAANLPRPS